MSEAAAGLGLSVQELTDAWMYLFGRYLVIRQEHLDLNEEGADYNAIKHNPPVLAGSDSGSAPTFVNPNLDVVYSEAWIAVDPETPTLLEIPKIPSGTYYTAQIVDEWAEITYNINERTFPQQPNGTYAICLAGSDPELPEGARRLDIPSNKAKLLARVQIGADVAQAVTLQHGFDVHSVGTPRVDPAIDIPLFTNATPPGADMFNRHRLSQALAAPDRPGQGDYFRPQLDKIADFVAVSPENAEAIDHLVNTQVYPVFIQYMTHLGTAVNGWSSTGNRAGFGSDYKFRAAANFAGIWWNSPPRSSTTCSNPTAPAHYRPATTATWFTSLPVMYPNNTSTATGP